MQYAVVKPSQLDSKKFGITPSEKCTIPMDGFESPVSRAADWLKSGSCEDRLPWAVFHARAEVSA